MNIRRIALALTAALGAALLYNGTAWAAPLPAGISFTTEPVAVRAPVTFTIVNPCVYPQRCRYDFKVLNGTRLGINLGTATPGATTFTYPYGFNGTVLVQMKATDAGGTNNYVTSSAYVVVGGAA